MCPYTQVQCTATLQRNCVRTLSPLKAAYALYNRLYKKPGLIRASHHLGTNCSQNETPSWKWRLNLEVLNKSRETMSRYVYYLCTNVLGFEVKDMCNKPRTRTF